MTKKKTEAFDMDKALDEYVCSDMFKAGLRYYINVNNLEAKNMKEFEKIVDDYSKIEMGG